MDWSDPRVWAAVVIIFNFVFWVLGQVMRPRFATTTELNREAARTTANAHEIELLKQRVGNLPTHDTVQELRDDIGELKEGQARTGAQLEGIGRTVSRIDDFLRTNK
jgi:hypothetical protein